MADSRRHVLITGCSDGGAGAALALAFQKAGLHVIATARSLSKMKSLQLPNIDRLELDVTSSESIQACLKKIDKLDILVNNAGAVLTMPVTDLSLDATRQLFELNVFSVIAMIQACLPLILQSTDGLIVTHTSSGAGLGLPWHAAYNASKAAAANFSDVLRVEMQPFGVKVVDLRSAMIKTNVLDNNRNINATESLLPKGSIYEPAQVEMDKALRQEPVRGTGIDADVWATAVVKDLMRPNPPFEIWRGENAALAYYARSLPRWITDMIVKGFTNFEPIARLLAADKKRR